MSASRPLHLLFLSTSVAPLGSGIGGGVELTLLNLSRELTRRGHQLEVIAPEGSALGGQPVIQMPGKLQPKAQNLSRKEIPASPDNSVLSNMCEFARRNQYRYDLIVNFSYDWLPLYLTVSFDTPLLHFISMSSLNDAMDFELIKAGSGSKNRIGCYSHAQAETFPDPNLFTVLGSGIDLDLYSYCDTPDEYIVWIGRIAREKALEDAFHLAQTTGCPLKVMGKMEERQYWDEVSDRYKDAQVDYEGFLSTREMQTILRKARALLMTPKWVEAFGIVAIEALACGVPVISYRKGGPSEIVQDGITGYLTKPGSITGLAEALSKIENIDRKVCRLSAEQTYSLEAWGDRFEQWFHSSTAQSSAFL